MATQEYYMITYGENHWCNYTSTQTYKTAVIAVHPTVWVVRNCGNNRFFLHTWKRVKPRHYAAYQQALAATQEEERNIVENERKIVEEERKAKKEVAKTAKFTPFSL
jgi:hypothetical protein